IERGSQVLKGAAFGTHRSGHWVAAAEPDLVPVAMEVFEPYLRLPKKPLRIVRVVADGDRVGLMINQEESIEQVLSWLAILDEVAGALEDAASAGRFTVRR